MNLEKIAPIMEAMITKALETKKYPFGIGKNSGIGNKVASGTLRDSIEVQTSKDSNGNSTISVLMDDYFQWVQSGRLPGKKGVPIDSIVQWIKDRKLQGRNQKNGRFITQRSFAFAIQTNIKKFGIRPSNFLDGVFEEIANSAEIQELLEGATMEDLINTIEGI